MLRKFKISIILGMIVLLAGVTYWTFFRPNHAGRAVTGTYTSPDSYFRQNICGTGVCDFAGPKAYLRMRFVKDQMSSLEHTPAVSGGTVFASGECQGGKLPILISFDEYSGNVLWRCEKDSYSTADITDSPFATSKTVFVGDDAGNIYCVDRSKGEITWTKKPSTTQCRSTPIVYDGRVYVGGSDFYCLDEKSGDLIWSYAVPEWGVEGSPAYCDGLIFFGERRGIIHALDAKTGKEVWSLGTVRFLLGSSIGGPIYSSPAVADNTMCIGVGKKLFGIEAGSGKEIWTFGPLGDTIGSCPAIWQKRVYLLAQERSGVWQCYCLDLQKGELQWQCKIDGKLSFFTSPVISDGIVYFGDTNGILYALDAKTGRVVFKEKVADTITSSVAIHDHAVFFAGFYKLWCVEDYRFNPLVIEIACTYEEFIKRELELTKEGAEALAFVEKEKWYEKPEYFLLILESARDQFVEPAIHALERLTGEKFTGDLSDVKAAREKAYKQYSDWAERHKAK